MIGLLDAELRKSFSTKLWWALLIPIVLLSLLANAFGGLFTEALAQVGPTADPVPPLVLVTTAYALSLTSVFAAVLGAVSAGGEFRHRTITTTYLLAGGRDGVLAAKLAVNALVGAGYAAVAALFGALTGVLAYPDAGSLLAAMVEIAGVGMLVCALWAAAGAAVGIAFGNQVAALVVLLLYLLAGELVVSSALIQADTEAVAMISAYLPGNAGDVALYGLAVGEAFPWFDATAARETVGLLAIVTHPPAWWVGLLALSAWTAVLCALGVLVARHRDVT